MKITPRIGYNCHHTMMEEMAELLEACNNGGLTEKAGGNHPTTWGQKLRKSADKWYVSFRIEWIPHVAWNRESRCRVARKYEHEDRESRNQDRESRDWC